MKPDEERERGVSAWGRAADAARLTLVVGAPTMLVLGKAADAYGLALLAVVAVAVRAARAPARLDMLFVTLLALDGWLTSFGAFASFNHNDTIGHVLLPAAVTPLLYHLMRRVGALEPIRPGSRAGLVGSIAILAALTTTLGTGWEIVEWLSDTVLGTDMSLGYTDTLLDLTADMSGASVGAIATVYLLGLRATGPSPVGVPR